MFVAEIFSCVLQLCCLYSHHPTFGHFLSFIQGTREKPSLTALFCLQVNTRHSRVTDLKREEPHLALPQENTGLECLSKLPYPDLTLGKTVKQFKSELDLWCLPFYISFLLFRVSPVTQDLHFKRLWGRLYHVEKFKSTALPQKKLL